MRKRIAGILIIVLFFTSIGDWSFLRAASQDEFSIKTEALFMDYDDTMRTVEYTLGATGLYEFDYFIEDNEKKGKDEQQYGTWRVALKFEKKSDNVVDVAISATGKRDVTSLENKEFSVRSISNNIWGDQEKVTTSAAISRDELINDLTNNEEFLDKGVVTKNQEFNKRLDSNRKDNSKGPNDTQIYLELNNIKVINKDGGQSNLIINIKKDGNKISFTTNGIKKGLVTCFRLKKGDETESDTKYVFPGVAGLEVEAQHFYITTEGTLASAEVLPEEPKAKEEDKMNAGERPGLLVSYGNIRKIDINKCEFINDNNTNYEMELRLDNMILNYNTSNNNNEVKSNLSDKPIENAKQDVDGKTQIKLANDEDIKNFLGEKYKYKEIIPWKGLTSSHIIRNIRILTTMIYDNGKKETFTEYKDNESIAKYTYLNYDLGQTVDGKVYLDLVPYKTTDYVEYYVFVDSEAALNKENLAFDKDNKDEGKSLYQKKIVPDGSKDKLKIEIAAEEENQRYVRVVAVVDKNKYYYSQIVKIDKSKLVSEPEIPTGLSVSNIVVTPSSDEDGIPAAVRADLKWNAPADLVEAYLKGGKGTLYYELILRDITNKEDEDIIPGTSSKAAYAKIYKVSSDGSKLEAIGANETIESKNVNGQFSVDNVYFKKVEQKEWSQIGNNENLSKHWEDPDSSIYTNVQEVDTLTDKVTGKTYYLSLRAVYVTNDNKITSSGESSLVAFPVDYTKDVIPVVETVEYDKTKESFNDKGNVNGEIGFNHVDITQYVNNMVTPAGLKLSDNDSKPFCGKYEFYMYKKGTTFDESKAVSVGTKSKDNNEIDLAINELEDGIIKWEYSIDELIGKTDVNPFDEIMRFKNLQANTAYMIKVRVKLEPIGKEARYSEYSKIFTFTTNTQANKPGTDERKPTVPSDISVEPVEGSNNSAKVTWKQANFVKDEDMEIYYELIRSSIDIRKELSDKQMADSMENIIANKNRILGFATLNPKGGLPQNDAKYMTYENGTWSILEPQKSVPVCKYEKIESPEDLVKYEIIDSKLAPNNVYYYYVRTVCIIKDGNSYSKVEDYPTIRSEWISASITTASIEPPKNLKVEKSTAYSHDTKHEVVISFDAEVPLSADIPNDYDFDIAIKTDEDEEYTIVNSKVGPLEKKATEQNGWTRFVYKIPNLKSSTRYNIKVRVIDKATKITDTDGLEQGALYAKSFYSEIVMTRTDYDEEDQKDQEAYDKYLKRLEDEIEKIKSNPYWKLENSGEYKYKLEYAEAGLAYGGTYSLVNNDKDSTLKYYLPSKLVQFANENNTILEIQMENVKASIRPNTLLEDQQEIKEAIEAISNGDISEYYLVINTATKNVDLDINGEKSISPKMQFELSIEYMKQTDDEINESILKELDSIVQTEKDSFISKIKKELERSKLDEDRLDDLVKDSIAEIETRLGKQTSRILDKANKRTYSISSVNKPILITFESGDVLGNAYYEKGNWLQVPSYSTGNEILVEIQKWGWYIITGMKNLIDTVPSLAPYQGFISKYGLTEVFQMDNYMINTAATKQQIYSALAKVLGAPSQTDYTMYLNAQGIKGASKLTASKNIRTDEAIYLIMQGYEKLHHTNVKSINISNRQSVQNIGAFQPMYQDYVYAAVQLKVVIPENNKIYPSTPVSIETVIKMLYNIQK